MWIKTEVRSLSGWQSDSRGQLRPHVEPHRPPGDPVPPTALRGAPCLQGEDSPGHPPLVCHILNAVTVPRPWPRNTARSKLGETSNPRTRTRHAQQGPEVSCQKGGPCRDGQSHDKGAWERTRGGPSSQKRVIYLPIRNMRATNQNTQTTFHSGGETNSLKKKKRIPHLRQIPRRHLTVGPVSSSVVEWLVRATSRFAVSQLTDEERSARLTGHRFPGPRNDHHDRRPLRDAQPRETRPVEESLAVFEEALPVPSPGPARLPHLTAGAPETQGGRSTVNGPQRDQTAHGGPCGTNTASSPAMTKWQAKAPNAETRRLQRFRGRVPRVPRPAPTVA